MNSKTPLNIHNKDVISRVLIPATVNGFAMYVPTRVWNLFPEIK